MRTDRKPHDKSVYLWYTDALCKKPQKTSYPHQYDTRRNEWVSTIGVPFRHQNEAGGRADCHPKIVGWEDQMPVLGEPPHP